ncbi:MAG: NUDIX hydrolase N-terminal domain-containing protein, partial [Dehalococcoidia bacterium]
MIPQWLDWAQRLQALAQTGLTYAQDPFDRERYAALQEIAVQILARQSGIDLAEIRGLIADEA